jgi:hypothetical protein
MSGSDSGSDDERRFDSDLDSVADDTPRASADAIASRGGDRLRSESIGINVASMWFDDHASHVDWSGDKHESGLQPLVNRNGIIQIPE